MNAQIIMIHRMDSGDINGKDKKKIYNFLDNQQEQKIGLIYIMSGWKKISWHVNQISIKLFQTKFGFDNTTNTKYLEYQLVMQKSQKKYISTQKHQWYIIIKINVIVVWVVWHQPFTVWVWQQGYFCPFKLHWRIIDPKDKRIQE